MNKKIKKAKIVKVKYLYRLNLDININKMGKPILVWDNYCLEYDFDKREIRKTPDKVIPQFPIIYKKNETPWDFGNLYLYDYWCNEAEIDAKPLSTIIKKAKNLLAYLQWLEDTNLHELYAPIRSRKYQRVTYMYKSFLENQVNKRVNFGEKHGLSQSTASGKAAEVAQLYQWIEKKNTELSFLPSDIKIKQIFYSEVKTMRRQGNKFIEYFATDLHLKSSTKREKLFDGCIYAEESTSGVKPLSARDVKIFLWALKEATNDRQMQLMHWFLLFTGARKQVVCTLTVGAIRLAMETYKTKTIARIPVGMGTLIDNKKNHTYYVQVPMELLQQIYNWVMYSPIYKRRQKLSFYGNSDKNYAFLTKNGNPFYMSKRQIRDIQDFSVSNTVAKKDRFFGGGKSNEGAALNYFVNNKLIVWINENLNELIDRWNKENINTPHFKPDDSQQPFQEGFHEQNLRATFGMQFVRRWEQALIEKNQTFNNKERTVCMGMLMKLMGHQSEVTTWHYLDYDQLAREKFSLDIKIENALYPKDTMDIFDES